jgi:hypothetical protein
MFPLAVFRGGEGLLGVVPYIYIYICMHVIYMNIYICMHVISVNIYMCVCVCVCVFVCVCTRSYVSPPLM